MPTLFGDHLTVKTKSVQSGYREEPRDWLPASEVVRMRRDSEFSICRPCTTVVAVVITTVVAVVITTVVAVVITTVIAVVI